MMTSVWTPTLLTQLEERFVERYGDDDDSVARALASAEDLLTGAFGQAVDADGDTYVTSEEYAAYTQALCDDEALSDVFFGDDSTHETFFEARDTLDEILQTELNMASTGATLLWGECPSWTNSAPGMQTFVDAGRMDVDKSIAARPNEKAPDIRPKKRTSTRVKAAPKPKPVVAEAAAPESKPDKTPTPVKPKPTPREVCDKFNADLGPDVSSLLYVDVGFACEFNPSPGHSLVESYEAGNIVFVGGEQPVLIAYRKGSASVAKPPAERSTTTTSTPTTPTSDLGPTPLMATQPGVTAPPAGLLPSPPYKKMTLDELIQSGQPLLYTGPCKPEDPCDDDDYYNGK